MTGTLLPALAWRAVDADGAPLVGALLQSYVGGTTTPTPLYTDATLVTPLSNPVVADSGGLFAPMFMNPAVSYRLQLKTAGGSVIADIDPAAIGPAAATQAQVNAGTDSGTFISPATLAGWTGVAAALGYTPVNRAGDTATNLAIAPTAPASNSAGYLGVPVNNQTASYALVLADAGKLVRMNSGSASTLTLPANSSVAYPVDTAIAVRNIGAGTCTVTRASGVTLRLAGSTTSQDAAMSQWGLAVMVKEDADTWVIQGTGLA
jgi:hypothetical protein